MADTLTDTEVAELVELGERIRVSLACDANGDGLPCRTDRFAAVEAMIEYLVIHGDLNKEGAI